MTQLQLNECVADRTGESLKVIQQRGFHLETFTSEDDEENQPLLCLNCPFCGAPIVLGNGPDDLPEVAECSRCDTLFSYKQREVYSADLDELEPSQRREYRPAA